MCFRISRAKGSGEYAITHLLAPGAYARMPIVDRINKIKVPVAFLCESSPVSYPFSLTFSQFN